LIIEIEGVKKNEIFKGTHKTKIKNERRIN